MSGFFFSLLNPCSVFLFVTVMLVVLVCVALCYLFLSPKEEHGENTLDVFS